MTRNHQPDQADFRVILPEDIDWNPFPAFPPGASSCGRPSDDLRRRAQPEGWPDLGAPGIGPWN